MPQLDLVNGHCYLDIVSFTFALPRSMENLGARGQLVAVPVFSDRRSLIDISGQSVARFDTLGLPPLNPSDVKPGIGCSACWVLRYTNMF